MNQPVDDPDTLTPPARPDTLREVDWVAVAPWLELLDTPRRTLGYGFLLGAIGAVLLGGVPGGRPAALADYPELALAACEGVASPIRAVRNVFVAPDGEARGWGAFAIGLAKLIAWAWLGLVIARRAAVGVGDGVAEGLVRTLVRSLLRMPRLLGVFGVATVPAALVLLDGLPNIGHLLLNSGSALLSLFVAIIWGCLLVITVVTALIAIGFLGAPLLWAAIAVDDSDAFDAASRMFAYTYQRLARLAFYVGVLAACGVAAGLVIELLASATLAVAGLGVPADLTETPAAIVTWWDSVFTRALRGFYPAYFFTAAVTLYLQLRRDIDGQPTDEVAGSGTLG